MPYPKGFLGVPEYPMYSVSKCGTVYSLHVSRPIKPYLNNKGYPCVRLNKDGIESTILLSRLLCRVFKNLPSLDSELEVDHIDTNPANFDLDNLQVLSKEDHTKKSCIDQGLVFRGTESKKCTNCGGRKSPESKLCSECYTSSRIKTDISKDSIEYWVREFSWVRAGRELGLSDNGLRKRYKSLGGDPKSLKK